MVLPLGEGVGDEGVDEVHDLDLHGVAHRRHDLRIGGSHLSGYREPGSVKFQI